MNRIKRSLPVWICWWIVTFFCLSDPRCGIIVRADDDEYVRQVLEEEAAAYGEDGGGNYYHEDDYYKREEERRAEAESQRQAEAERIAQEQADKIASERERAFQAQLDKMSAEQQKAALRQKRKDAKTVRSVLKASKRKDYYQVLGIRNWNWKVPPREFDIFGLFSFKLPGISLKETTMKDIRRAYRNRAMTVHPDKNRDGRAQEAFIEVENAVSILSDNQLREEYDEDQRLRRLEQREGQLDLVLDSLASAQSMALGTLKAIRALLGPFATPVFILGFLLI